MPCANEPVTALARPKETRTEMDIEMNRAELLTMNVDMTMDQAASESSLAAAWRRSRMAWSSPRGMEIVSGGCEENAGKPACRI